MGTSLLRHLKRLGGVCIVMLNKSKPFTRIVGWSDEKWFFMPCRDYGGYAEVHYPCVLQLRRGRN